MRAPAQERSYQKPLVYFRLRVGKVDEHCLKITKCLSVIFDLRRLVRHACTPCDDGEFPVCGEPKVIESRGLAGLGMVLVQIEFGADLVLDLVGAVVSG